MPPATVRLWQLTFRGRGPYAVDSEDVQIGEVESVEPRISFGGTVIAAPLRRLSLTVNLKGLTQEQANPWIQEADGNAQRLLTNSAYRETMNFAGQVIRDAVLMKAVPSDRIVLRGTALIGSLQLEFHSTFFR